MANIKLTGHTWDASGIWDTTEEKSQAQSNAAKNAAIAPTQASTTASSKIDAGSRFWLAGVLYIATADIAQGATIVTSGAGQNCKPDVLGADVSELKNATNALDETVNGVITRNFTEGKIFSANSTSYSIDDNENSCISDYIPATWESDDKIGFGYTDDTTDAAAYKILCFDSSKNYLGNFIRNNTGTNSRQNLTPYTGTAFVRISFKKGFAGYVYRSGYISTKYYTAASTVTTDGHEQKIGDLNNLATTDKSNLVSAINEVKRYPSFFHISKNMIDPDTCVLGEMVNQTNGEFQSAPGHNRTSYIEISPNTTYVVRARSGSFANSLRYVFYDSSKTRISGEVGALPDMLLTSPANAKYIAISNSSAPSNMMIAPYVNEDKSFEAYNNIYVEPEYIVPGDADSIILNIPTKMYALVGYELNIYFENITEDWTLYKWDVTCTKGMQLERGYRITPIADDAGEYTLTIRASISEDIYKEVSTTLIVTGASAGTGETASVIIMGDSTTDNGIVITKLNANFAEDAMGVSTIGTRGTSPNNHEGRSGWKFEDYLTKASETYTDGRGTVYNPFYNPTSETFDADYYFTNSGISKPDWFFVNLGINDVFGASTDAALNTQIDAVIERCDTVVDSLLDATTTTKVGICLTIPCNHSQDAFGKAYGCNQTRDRCKRNNTFWVKKLIEEYDGREDERIYLIPINASLDTIYNMGMETIPVNARNETTYSSPIYNGGVHPVASGYWQIADVYTAIIKANAS